jgi:hypothetical protein
MTKLIVLVVFVTANLVGYSARELRCHRAQDLRTRQIIEICDRQICRSAASGPDMTWGDFILNYPEVSFTIKEN